MLQLDILNTDILNLNNNLVNTLNIYQKKKIFYNVKLVIFNSHHINKYDHIITINKYCFYHKIFEFSNLYLLYIHQYIFNTQYLRNVNNYIIQSIHKNHLYRCIFYDLNLIHIPNNNICKFHLIYVNNNFPPFILEEYKYYYKDNNHNNILHITNKNHNDHKVLQSFHFQLQYNCCHLKINNTYFYILYISRYYQFIYNLRLFFKYIHYWRKSKIIMCHSTNKYLLSI